MVLINFMLKSSFFKGDYVFQIIGALIAGIFSVIAAIVEFIVAAIWFVIKLLIQALKWVIKLIPAIFKFIVNIFKAIFKFIANIFKVVFKFAIKAFKGLLKAISSGIGKIKALFSPATKAVKATSSATTKASSKLAVSKTIAKTTLPLTTLTTPNVAIKPHTPSKIVPKSISLPKLPKANPKLQAKVNLKTGKITEGVMSKYFTKAGKWKKIEGEVGRNGIDGLFIKKKNGKISKVLLVESKFNTSKLANTKHGKQMSKEWALKKIDNLIKKYPNNKDYKTIKKMILKDQHKAILWKMKTEGNKVIISTKKISSKNSDVKLQNLKAGEKLKINYKQNQVIDVKNPQNKFQENFTKWLQESIKENSK